MPKRKVTLYFRDEVLAETQREAVRQDRSISWIIQAAWKIARGELKATLPDVDEPDPGDPSPDPDAPARQARGAVSPKPSLPARVVSPCPPASRDIALATRQARGKG